VFSSKGPNIFVKTTSDQTQQQQPIISFGSGSGGNTDKEMVKLSNSQSAGTLLSLPEIKGTPNFTLNSTSKKSTIMTAGVSSLQTKQFYGLSMNN
jgi:hypothetical protein